MNRRIIWFRALLVVILLPLAITAFAVLGGVEVMTLLAERYFCEAGMKNCNQFVVNSAEFFIAYWWFISVVFYAVGLILAQITIIFDSAISLPHKAAWSVGINFFGILVVPVYCRVRLRQIRILYPATALRHLNQADKLRINTEEIKAERLGRLF